MAIDGLASSCNETQESGYVMDPIKAIKDERKFLFFFWEREGDLFLSS